MFEPTFLPELFLSAAVYVETGEYLNVILFLVYEYLAAVEPVLVEDSEIFVLFEQQQMTYLSLSFMSRSVIFVGSRHSTMLLLPLPNSE